MKKLLLILLVVPFFSFAQEENEVAESIYGEWKLHEYSSEDDLTQAMLDMSFEGVETTFDFKKDGTVEIISELVVGDGLSQWSLNDDGTEITITSGESVSTYELKVNLGIMIWQQFDAVAQETNFVFDSWTKED